MRVLAPFILASAFIGGPLLAESKGVPQGPLPDWVTPSDPLPVPADVSGPVFFRRQDAIAHLHERGQSIYSGYRLKILNANALDAGNISISWNPAAGSPIVHAITVYRGADTIDVLKSTSFEVLRREDQLETARLDGVLTAVLRVPDLRVGDELEVAVTTPGSDPTLGVHDAGALVLGPSPFPGRYNLELGWDKGFEPKEKMTPDMAAVMVRTDHSIAFRFDNPTMLTPPKDAPPRYQVQRMVEYSGLQDWPAVSRVFAPLFVKAARLDEGSLLKDEVRRIAANNATPLDRARAALKMVQQDVRYVYVGLDRGNFTPATADDTWKRRYGDCKAKTALLLALLSELAIPAEAVLVNNSGGDDGMDQRLPSPRLFDHVLVRATIEGKTWWLDGTLPPVALPTTAAALPYRWVLPLSVQGSGLEQLEWRSAQRPDEINLFDIDARGGFDAPAKVTTTSILRGIKGLQQQQQLSPISEGQLLAAFRQKFLGSPWQSIDAVKWRYDEKAQASIVSVTGTWTLDWEKNGGGARSMPLPGGGFNSPDKHVRSPDQDQKAPYYNEPRYSCMVATLRIPAATRLDNWSTKNGYDAHIFGENYYRTFERRDGAIRMIRGYRAENLEVDAGAALKDNARIEGFDNSMAYIFYDPTSRVPLRPVGKPVPTVDEIDWTREDVPCLPTPVQAALTGK